MAIRIMIEVFPDGWNYRWVDVPEGAEQAEQFSGKRPTLEDVLDAVNESIREKLPLGRLQGDDVIQRDREREREKRNEVQGSNG